MRYLRLPPTATLLPPLLLPLLQTLVVVCEQSGACLYVEIALFLDTLHPTYRSSYISPMSLRAVPAVEQLRKVGTVPLLTSLAARLPSSDSPTGGNNREIRSGGVSSERALLAAAAEAAGMKGRPKAATAPCRRQLSLLMALLAQGRRK